MKWGEERRGERRLGMQYKKVHWREGETWKIAGGKKGPQCE